MTIGFKVVEDGIIGSWTGCHLLSSKTTRTGCSTWTGSLGLVTNFFVKSFSWKFSWNWFLVSYFGGESGFVYLISAEQCNDYLQSITESYDEMLERQEAADNPYDVDIPVDYNILYNEFTVYTGRQMLNLYSIL